MADGDKLLQGAKDLLNQASADEQRAAKSRNPSIYKKLSVQARKAAEQRLQDLQTYFNRNLRRI